MKEIGKDGMDRTASPGEFPPGRSKHYIFKFFNILLEMNETKRIQSNSFPRMKSYRLFRQ